VTVTRGRLRVYLGAAPGVGKTYAMLNEGCRRQSRGTDVVVGYVEAHGRRETTSQLRGLDAVPRRSVTSRGQAFEEMDVDAILRRRPAVALVDELAHTNVPGSRNQKRWQDIDELLDAGIDVISTVNIQHLESLNDVVEAITGVEERETVPDVFVRGADQVELVDMTPEALRRRMAHGNIYAPDEVDAALANFFRPGNLGALRELALLWMAEKVDESLHDYRARHDIERQWETRERVAVALTGAPGSGNVIRRAARMANRLRGELIGIHVVATDGLSVRAGPELAEQLALLKELGGRYVEVVGDDVAQALVEAARAENATQILLGASRRSRWTELTRGSVVNAVVRAAAPGVDVHVIAQKLPKGELDVSRVTWRRPSFAPLPVRRTAIAVLLAAIGLPLLTLVLTQLRPDIGIESALPCYLLLVVVIAAIGGLVPALVSSCVAFALLNWFFTPPLHTLSITNARDVVALTSFIVLSAVVSSLVDLAARRRNDAARSHAEARALATMAATILRDPDPLPSLTAQLASAFALDGVAVLTRDEGDTGWKVETSAGHSPPADVADATMTLDLGDRSVLVISGPRLRADDRLVLSGFATQLSLALQGARLQRDASNAITLARTNELRTALLQAVSHDLRTPLASIRAAATSLLSDDVEWDPDATRELLEMIDDEAERLNRIVANLLDMSRLQTGGVDVRAAEVGLDEVVAAAVGGLHLGPEAIDIEIDPRLPRVIADPALLERVVANVVDNATHFSPPGAPGTPGAPIVLSAARVGASVHLRVADRGPGIPDAMREQVFKPFQRLGDQPKGIGVGLGLAVARGFVEAIGGRIEIDDTPGGGCTVVIVLRAEPDHEATRPGAPDAEPLLTTTDDRRAVGRA
jgi:two-component system sensor histidine kinase KdpD